MNTSAPNEVFKRRQENFERARSGVDLLVVGGGINGASVARDAQMRGLKVLLVEERDWASGTSSKSSKLVHGGLRYLENYEFGLVMESTRERYLQWKLNPHLVTPLPFVFPVYQGDKNSLFKINLGLWLYDLLALLRAPKLHKKMKPDATLEKVPGLKAHGLKGSLHYYDCAVDDARLSLANMLDARSRGAITLSRTRFLEAAYESGGQKAGAKELGEGKVDNHGVRVRSASILDCLSGERFEIPCRHIAFTTGPWTDETWGPTAKTTHTTTLRPTKGVHIAFPRQRLPIETALVMAAKKDGRVVFAIPRHEITYVGTTDTDFTGDPAKVHADKDDIHYLLETVNHYFPDAKLQVHDIQSLWAGLRPLVKSDATSAYKTSREQQIFEDERGLSAMAGGKLTTYRNMAKQHVNHIIKDLKKDLQSQAGKAADPLPRLKRCQTKKVPLAKTQAPSSQDAFLGMLYAYHGDLYEKVLERLESHPEEKEPIAKGLPYVRAQLAVAVLYEDAFSLEDLLVRRFPVFYESSDAGLLASQDNVSFLAQLLGQDKAWEEAELSRYEQHLEEELACLRTPSPAPLFAPQPTAPKEDIAHAAP